MLQNKIPTFTLAKPLGMKCTGKKKRKRKKKVKLQVGSD